MPHPEDLLGIGSSIEIRIERTHRNIYEVLVQASGGVTVTPLRIGEVIAYESEGDPARLLFSFDSKVITHAGSELSFGQAVAQLVSAYLDETP